MDHLSSILAYAFRFANHPIVQILSPLLGIAGLAMSIAQIVLTPPRRKLCYQVSEYPNERTWVGQEVGLKVALWNGGRKMIRSSDIAKPIRINSPSGSCAIAARITASSDETHLRVHVDPDKPCSVIVEFDVLDPGDGGVLELTYIGEADMILSMRGSIIGCGKILRVDPSMLGDVAYFGAILAFSWALFLIGHASASRTIGFLLMTIGIAFYPAVLVPAFHIRNKMRSRKEPFSKLEKKWGR